MKNHVLPVIAITVGDPNGIGPEIVLKSLNHRDIRNLCRPVLVGPPDVFFAYAHHFKMRVPSEVPILSPKNTGYTTIRPGIHSATAGRVAGEAITEAVALATRGVVDAIVTTPVSKQALHLAGFNYPGQTEMVQRLSNSRHAVMMLVSDAMRVGLVTIHVPINRVARLLSRPLLKEKVTTVHNALKANWRIRSPRIAVLALNPHAGENGDIGTEDRDIIAPVIKQLQRNSMKIDGPFPADAFFGRYKPGEYDAIIAMYHDQGLIPLKMSSFGKGVNVTVGMRIIRTSPDHGTAFDIAGKGIADECSMIEAIRLAMLHATNRKRSP